MSFPKKGMVYEDVRSRLKKYKSVKTNPNMKRSLINQARLHEGEGVVKELVKEMDSNNHSTNRVGYSPRYSSNWERIFNKGSE